MLKLVNIIKNYPSATTTVQALRGVSLAFREHEFVAILGPSGCGKSTMLNIIGGLDRYTEGDLVIGGVSTTSFDDLHWDAYRNATIGFVFQSYNLIPHLTVLENVEMALSLAGQKKKVRRAKAVAALHRVGMGDEINKRPNQLSGGQMQRVAIARALVTQPKIILADEPTGALDSELSVQVMDLLKEISETCLVIMVTHNAELAQEYCSRICRFKDGSLISDSNPYTFEEEAEEIAGGGGLNAALTSNLVEAGEGAEKAETAEGAEDVENVKNVEAEGEDVTTDTLSLLDEEIKPETGEQVEENAGGEEVDYSHLYANEDEETKSKKVSNRKRKKEMKAQDVLHNDTFNKLGLNNLNKKKKTAENKKDKSFKPTSMNAAMAFGLSLRNLWSKKGRTFFTAFASSIGIIGLGLVLAISNGFDVFVDKMQTEMMAGMPLGIYEYNVEVSMINEMMNVVGNLDIDEDAFPDSDEIKIGESAGADSMINEIISSFLSNVDENILSEEFDEYIQNLGKEKYNNETFEGAVSTYYGLRYNLITKGYDDKGKVRYKDSSQTPPVASVMSIAMTIFGQQGLQPAYWQMMVGDEANMMKSYDFVGANSRYPQNANEILMSVSASNRIDKDMLDQFGIALYELDENGDPVIKNGVPKELAAEDITADTFIGRKIKLVYNNSYYKEAETQKYDLTLVPDYDYNNQGWSIKETSQSLLKRLYDEGEGMELTIVGVIRPKRESQSAYVGNCFCYTPQLQDLVLENAFNSDIAKRQQTLIEQSMNPEQGFYAPVKVVFGGTKKDTDVRNLVGVTNILGATKALSSFLKSIGAIKVPSYINVYPVDFSSKQLAADYIGDFEDKDGNTIGYLDVSEMITYYLHIIIDLVSVILIAVASISLVVSTAMIGVITANSVIERIREIGILRALGARKRDIRNVFVAETSLLGVFGGVMGIVITYIICPIISVVVKHFTGVPGLLQFNPLHALLLVVLSIALTVISGVVPAISASRKNVVDALRVE